MPFHALPYLAASGIMTMLACITSQLLPQWSRHLDLCERAQLDECFQFSALGD